MADWTFWQMVGAGLGVALVVRSASPVALAWLWLHRPRGGEPE